MDNPITKVGIFHTPESMDELQSTIEKLSGSERAIATQFMCFTWNLASATVDKAIEEANKDKQPDPLLDDQTNA